MTYPETMPEKCRYCGTSFFKIVEKEETYIIDGKPHVRYWIGCQSCWDKLQRIS